MPLFCEPRDRGEVFLSYMDLIVGCEGELGVALESLQGKGDLI